MAIHIQNVKGLLRLLSLQKVLQAPGQDVCPAQSAHLSWQQGEAVH